MSDSKAQYPPMNNEVDIDEILENFQYECWKDGKDGESVHHSDYDFKQAKAAIEQKIDLERKRTLEWFIGTLKHNSYEDTIKLANIQLESLQHTTGEEHE